jgi:hypothetical protein
LALSALGAYLGGYLDHPEAEVSALCDADPAILASVRLTPRCPRDTRLLSRLDLDLIEMTLQPQEAMTVAALAGG